MATFVDALKRMCDTLVPAGTMVHFAGKSIPTGWLLCNGAAISRTTYARLYSAIGTTWGTGNGSTTFNLPNTNGRFLEGTTTTSNVGTALSAGLPNITGYCTWANNGFPANTYSVQSSVYAKSSGALSVTKDGGAYGAIGSSGDDSANSNAKISINAKSSSSLFNGATTVQPPAIYTLIIIKV